jgi:hypothetical protein
MDGSTFSKVRDFISLALEGKQKLVYSFIECQQMIPDNMKYDVQGSKEFFEWYKELDLTRAHGKDVGVYRNLYNRLPFQFQSI